MFTSTLLYAGLLPAATAAVVVAFLAARVRLSPPAMWASGTAAGVVAGLLGLKSRGGFAVALRSFAQPGESADWLPLIVLLAWGITMLSLAAPPTKRGYVLVVAAVFVVAVPLRLLDGNVRLARAWSLPDKLACLAVLAAVLGVTWRLLAADGDHRHAVVKLPLIVATVLVSALALTFAAHVLVYGEACGTLAAALTGTALARILPLPLALARIVPLPLGEGWGEGHPATGIATAAPANWANGLAGAAAPITFTLGSYLILGHFFADLSTLHAALLVASLAAAGPLPRPLRERPAWQQHALRLAAGLLPLLVVLVLTLAKATSHY